MPLFRHYQRYWSIIVLGLLCIPLLLHLSAILSGAKLRDNLSPWPGLPTGIWTLQNFPRELDAYLGDRFGGRDLLVPAYAKIKLALNSPSSNRVILGRGGWLYLTDNSAVQQSLGELHRVDDVEAMVRFLSKTDSRLKREGREFFAALIPNKHSVHVDTLPAWATKKFSSTEYETFVESMRHQGLSTVNLKRILKKAKTAEETALYRKTDTHWNYLGALFGFNAIVSASGRQDWKLEPSSVLTGPIRAEGGDLSRFLGTQSSVSDMDYYELKIPDPTDGLREWGQHRQRSYELSGLGSEETVLVVGDSFSRKYFRPYFAQNVKRLIWMHDNGCRIDWKQIGRVKPDRVYFLMVERRIRSCGQVID
jgi:alginate O-acetyltransferase complex protein AlgJ